MIASTTADTMTADTPIAVDAPMAIADDVSAGAHREATPPNRRRDGAEVEEQQLKRSREIWEHVKEEQYEGIHQLCLSSSSTSTTKLTPTASLVPVIEQLPLTLQRYLTLMRELDIQARGLYLVVPPAAARSLRLRCAAHLDAIPSALRQYHDLRHTLASRKHQHPQQPDPDPEQEQDPESETAEHAIVSPPLSPSLDFIRGRPRPSFSSASLTPVSDSSSSSVSDERSPSRDGHPLVHDDDSEIHLKHTDGTGAAPQLSSRSLISRIALLATDALRASNEKMNLADAAYATVCFLPFHLCTSHNMPAADIPITLCSYRWTDKCEFLMPKSKSTNLLWPSDCAQVHVQQQS